MNMKKIVASAAALSLTAAVAVGGTLAYLNASTTEVKNTFTYNAASQNVTLKLYEHDYASGKGTQKLYADDTSNWADSSTTQKYTIVPGGTAKKDPTLELTTGNTNVYVYAEIVTTGTGEGSNIADISSNVLTIKDEENQPLWEPLMKDGQQLTGDNDGKIYVLKACQDKTYETGMNGEEAKTANIPVFDEIQYGAITDLEEDVNASIAVYGYVVDVEAGDSALAAFEATF